MDSYELAARLGVRPREISATLKWQKGGVIKMVIGKNGRTIYLLHETTEREPMTRKGLRRGIKQETMEATHG
jgi:hypothetical protein